MKYLTIFTIAFLFSIIINAQPTINLQPTNTSVCEDASNADFSVISTGTITWQWEVDNGGGFVNTTDGLEYTGSSRDTLIAFSPLASKDGYAFRCKLTNGGGSIYTNVVYLTINALPTVTANSDDADNTVAECDLITLTGGGTVTYSWDNGVTDGVTFTSLLGITTYTVIGTDGNGCQNTDNIDITVNAATGPGNALDLDGTNDYINFGNNANLRFENNELFTFEAWIKPDVIGSEMAIYSDYDLGVTNGTFYLRILADGTVKATRNATPWDITSTTILEASKYYHIAVSYDNVNFTLYINGVLENQAGMSASAGTSSNNVYVGSSSSSSSPAMFFNGIIDEVRIWDNALTQKEIVNNMSKERSNFVSEANLVVYYKLNDGSGTAITDLKNSNNGTLMNSDADEWTDSEAFTTWKGSNSTSWSDAGNWTDGVPTANDNIGICANAYNPASMNTNTSVNTMVVTENSILTVSNTNNITIASNLFSYGTININPDNMGSANPGSLTINGNLYLETGSNLNLKTDASAKASGSLITNGSILGTGNVKFERYLTTDYRWQYVSSPIDDALSTLYTNHSSYGGNYNTNFYGYNEGYDGNDPANANYSNWDDFGYAWQAAHNNDGGAVPITMNTAQGYAFYNTAEIQVDYTSTATHLNTGNKSISLIYTDNDDLNGFGSYYDGWNLIGNPFPSAIDWENASWDKTYVDNTIYYWNGSNYVYYSGTPIQGVGQTLNNDAGGQYIPAGQAFFVHAKPSAGAGQNLVIDNDVRVHNGNELYKSSPKIKEFEFVKLELDFNGKTDEIIVRFFEEATKDFDSDYDAYKMFPYSDVPQIYTMSSNEFPLSINSLEPSEQEEVNILFIAKESGEYTISLNDANLFEETRVYLMDRYKKTRLLLTGSYTFYSEQGDFEDRFFLVFEKNTSNVENKENQNSVQIYTVNKNVKINFLNNNNTTGNYQIYDITGKLVKSGELNAVNNIVDMENSSSGIYIVKISNQKLNYSEKVFIK